MRPIRQWYGPLIDKHAAANEIDPLLVEAVIGVESSGRCSAYRYEPNFWTRYLHTNPQYAACNPERVSASYGLMQIMFTTAVEQGYSGEPEYLFVPSLNLSFGCAHLRHLLRWAGGDVRKAVAAYNGGQRNYQAQAPQLYADRVLARLEAIKRDHAE